MENGLMVEAHEEPGAWQEHWVRIRRWQSRFRQMCDGLPNGMTRDDAIDELVAFFLICYHFRDALIRSGSQETAVDAYIESSDVLAVCRDLAAGRKRITSAPMPPLGPSGRHYCEPLPGEQWLVETDAGPKDIFDLAMECMPAWRIYMARP